MNVSDLIERYPYLFHMAERDTWSSIKAKGLLSTTAALDLYQVNGGARQRLERGHRPQKVTVGPAGDAIVLRDQIPMAPDRLEVALIDGTTPGEWYELLNGKVFMWAEEARLHRLLKARYYRHLEHDVLTIDAAKLMKVHAERVWLCPMNSGNTFPVPHRRGREIFQRIDKYPTRATSGRPQKEVVEVVVDYSIPDIADFVVEVRRMQGDQVLHDIAL